MTSPWKTQPEEGMDQTQETPQEVLEIQKKISDLMDIPKEDNDELEAIMMRQHEELFEFVVGKSGSHPRALSYIEAVTTASAILSASLTYALIPPMLRDLVVDRVTDCFSKEVAASLKQMKEEVPDPLAETDKKIRKGMAEKGYSDLSFLDHIKDHIKS